MSSTLPESIPQIKKGEVIALINKAHPSFILPDFFITGIRGYYKNTMGKPSENDRKIYDDAIFLIGKDDFFAFNANTDPSAFRPQIANLKAGIWPVYKFDLHKGKYLALCQRAGEVTVIRDGQGEDMGMFGINIHKGGIFSTSSLGCQTIPPSQYGSFITNAQILAEKYNGKNWKKLTYTYVLLEI
jgi:hypothetical protein